MTHSSSSPFVIWHSVFRDMVVRYSHGAFIIHPRNRERETERSLSFSSPSIRSIQSGGNSWSSPEEQKLAQVYWVDWCLSCHLYHLDIIFLVFGWLFLPGPTSSRSFHWGSVCTANCEVLLILNCCSNCLFLLPLSGSYEHILTCLITHWSHVQIDLSGGKQIWLQAKQINKYEIKIKGLRRGAAPKTIF